MMLSVGSQLVKSLIVSKRGLLLLASTRDEHVISTTYAIGNSPLYKDNFSEQLCRMRKDAIVDTILRKYQCTVKAKV